MQHCAFVYLTCCTAKKSVVSTICVTIVDADVAAIVTADDDAACAARKNYGYLVKNPLHIRFFRAFLLMGKKKEKYCFLHVYLHAIRAANIAMEHT